MNWSPCGFRGTTIQRLYTQSAKGEPEVSIRQGRIQDFHFFFLGGGGANYYVRATMHAHYRPELSTVDYLQIHGLFKSVD